MGKKLEARAGEVKGQKSEGERQIQRFLRRCGLVYRYEYPLAVVERGKTRICYPDSVLPEYGITIEYAGLNGEEYEVGLRYKKSVYEELGIPARCVYPDSFRGYWPGRLLAEIEEIEEGRVKHLPRARKLLVVEPVLERG
jgi:hypothetical protein